MHRINELMMTSVVCPLWCQGGRANPFLPGSSWLYGSTKLRTQRGEGELMHARRFYSYYALGWCLPLLLMRGASAYLQLPARPGFQGEYFGSRVGVSCWHDKPLKPQVPHVMHPGMTAGLHRATMRQPNYDRRGGMTMGVPGLHESVLLTALTSSATPTTDLLEDVRTFLVPDPVLVAKLVPIVASLLALFVTSGNIVGKVCK